MAGTQKTFELLFQLRASLGGNFNSTFKGAMETQRQLQNSIKSVNSMQSKVDGYQKTGSAIERNQERLSRLAAEHDRLQAELKETAQKKKELQKALETAEAEGNIAEYKRLQSELSAAGREYDRLKERSRGYENQIQQTTSSIQSQEEQLGRLEQELREAGIDTDNLEQSNARLQRSYERMRNSQQTLQRLNQAQQNISESISHTKAQLVGTIGAMSAIAAAAYAGPIKTYQDFEEEMSKVAGITKKTGEELEALKNAAKQAGRTTWATATESAQALEYMSLAGWTSEQSIGALNDMLKIAKISGLDLGASTDLVTDSMSAMGKTVDELEHYLDVAVKANNVANTTSSDLMEAILGCGGAAKINGIELETLSTALAVFANNGLKGTQAGTAMNSILVRMTSNDKALSEMARLGVNAFDKQTGAFRDMGAILKDLEAKLSGMTDAERDASLKAIAGTNYYSQFAYLLDSVSEAAEGTAGSWDVLAEKLNDADGAAEEMYRTMMDNFSGAMTEAKSAIEAVQLALGEILTPALTEIVRAVTPVIQKIATFISENKEMVQRAAMAVSGLMAFRAGMLSLKLAGLTGAGGIVALLQQLMGLRIGFLESAATGTGFATKLKAALGPLGGIAGKFLPVIGIITTVIAVVQILRKNFDKVREAVGRIFGEKGLEIFDRIVAAVTSVGETIRGVFSDGNLGAARDKIQEIFGEKGAAVFDTFAGVFQKVVTAAGQFVGFVTTHIVPVVEQVLNVLISTVIPGIIGGVRAAAPEVMKVFQAVADFMGGIIPVIGDFIAGIMPIISEVIAFIQEHVLPVVKDIFGFIVSAVLPSIAQGIQQLGSIITMVLSAALPVVQAVFLKIWNTIQPVMQQIFTTVQAVLPAVLSIFQNVFDTIGGIISAVQQVLSGIIQFITGVFSGNWTQAWEGIKSIFSGAWEGILAVCKGMINGITGAVNVVIRGLNSLKVPDWVPGIGGEGINIPEIPQLARGSKNTPDTFIAGEEGPELITSAPGRTVYTAQQTKDIFNAQNAAAQAAHAAGAVQTSQVYYNAANNAPEVRLPEVAGGAWQQGGGNSVIINSSPTIYVESGSPGDFEEKLEENNRNLLREIEDLLDKKSDDERRSRYA